MKRVLIAAVLGVFACGVQGQVTEFELFPTIGNAGLLGSNVQPDPVSPSGSGGEIGAGISFDDSNDSLTINIGWGDAFGFTDLTSGTTGASLHGPATTEGTAPVLYDLTFNGFGDTDGSVTETISLQATPVYTIEQQVNQLFNSEWYITISSLNHSQTEGGELRGQLQPVPEPEEVALVVALGLLGFGIWRKKFKAQAEPVCC